MGSRWSKSELHKQGRTFQNRKEETMKQRNPVTKERRKSGRKVLAAVLSLAMILTLANPTTVFAAEKDGTE